jgi:hypothetical protein
VYQPGALADDTSPITTAIVRAPPEEQGGFLHEDVDEMFGYIWEQQAPNFLFLLDR